MFLVLKRLVKENAETTVSDSKSLQENFEYLMKVFGNPRAIWKKEKESFLKNYGQNKATFCLKHITLMLFAPSSTYATHCIDTMLHFKDVFMS